MLERLSTEKRNPQSMHLDEMSIREVLETMNKEDRSVPDSIAKELEHIEMVVKSVIQSFQEGGRLIYIGAGTSGRLGILDAVECVPTFGVSPETVQGFIAGGMKTFTVAVEGAEDSFELGAEDMQSALVSKKDTVVMEATEVDYETAEKFYKAANSHVKTAIVMILLQCTYKEAVEKLAVTGGFIKKTI